MKVIKWFDEHFEEFILIVFLVLISCITLLQVICRNVPAFPVLTWPEELCRFLWIATVFLSLPYTIRTETMLRVTALVDIMPWKVRNIINVIVDVVTFVMMAVLTNAAVTVLMRYRSRAEKLPLQCFSLCGLCISSFSLALHLVHCVASKCSLFTSSTSMLSLKSTIEEQTEFELESGNFDTEAIRNMGKEGG